ncbi:hypothetical protein BJ508DRAFT_344099 [Ascobolus immersus RN42]|uniref:F-box domain-containing protein n=1 Tax=Ascobolus immersus RN42 TaxID=1160509 RepID=A0A3N4ID26_ASCIM|nr:hypothetical protein BJ508DRAFT_344099 [Ascobolus immersus RN42]
MVQTRARKRLCTGFECPNDDSRPPVIQDLKKSSFLRMSVELQMEIFGNLDSIDDIGNLAKTSKHVWAVFENSVGIIVKKFFLPVELEFLNIQRPGFLEPWHADELRKRGTATIKKPTRNARKKSKKDEPEDECEFQASNKHYTYFPVEQATGSIVDRRLSDKPKVYRLQELRRLLANRKLVDSWMFGTDGVTPNLRLYGRNYNFKLETDPAKMIEGIPPELQIVMKHTTPSATELDDQTLIYRVRERPPLAAYSKSETNRFRLGAFHFALFQCRSIAFYGRRTISIGRRSYVPVNNYGAAFQIPFRELLAILGVLNSVQYHRYSDTEGPYIWMKAGASKALNMAYALATSHFKTSQGVTRAAWSELPMSCIWDQNSAIIDSALKVIESAGPEASWRQKFLRHDSSMEEIQSLVKELGETNSAAGYTGYYGFGYGYYGYGIYGTTSDDARTIQEIVFLNKSNEIHLRPAKGPLGVKLGGRNEEFNRPAIVHKPFLEIQEKYLKSTGGKTEYAFMSSYEDEE